MCVHTHACGVTGISQIHHHIPKYQGRDSTALSLSYPTSSCIYSKGKRVQEGQVTDPRTQKLLVVLMRTCNYIQVLPHHAYSGALYMKAWLRLEFMPSSLTWQVARGSSSLPHGSPHGAAQFFPRVIQERENQNGSCNVFYNLILQVMHHHLYRMLLVTQNNPGTM